MTMNEKEKIKSTILRQLGYGASCRIHLHREVCQELGLSIVPEVNPISGNRTRICKGVIDYRFNKFLDKLCDEKLIQKLRTKTIHIDSEEMKMRKTKTVEQISHYTFYELTKKGKEFLNKSRQVSTTQNI
jgi:hypothetical protein